MILILKKIVRLTSTTVPREASIITNGYIGAYREGCLETGVNIIPNMFLNRKDILPDIVSNRGY